MASTNNTTQLTPLAHKPKNLLDLPAEIRTQIYRYVFANVQVDAECASPASCFMAFGFLRRLNYHPEASLNAPDFQKLALTKVSRQLRQEALPVFLETASFDIGETCSGFYRTHLNGSLSRAAITNFENCKRRIRRCHESIWNVRPNTDSSSIESVASAWFIDQKEYPYMEEFTLHIKWFYEDYYGDKNCQRCEDSHFQLSARNILTSIDLEGLRTLVATKQPLRVNIEICLLMSREQNQETPNEDPEASTLPVIQIPFPRLIQTLTSLADLRQVHTHRRQITALHQNLRWCPDAMANNRIE